MFYRRKIVLALLEISGGSLSQSDCEKLLFLFCRRRGKNYYDFFPTPAGPQSFLLFQDKARLTALDLLAEQENYCLNVQQPFLPQLHKTDATILCTMMQEVEGKSWSESLTREMYSAYQDICQRERKDTTPTLFTLGYEGLSIDAYINILLINNINALIDVRKNPLSMKYGFSKTRFSNYLARVNIAYFHLPELGISSSLRQKLDSPGAYRALFDYYREHILPEQVASLEQLKAVANAQRRVVLTCFEADAHSCHRHEITDCLEKDVAFALPVFHLDKTCTCNTSFMYTTSTNTVHVPSKHLLHSSVVGD